MIRPLLAATIDPLKEPDVFSRLRFPLLASPKMDGIRALGYNYGAYSRKGLAIPSHQVQQQFVTLDGIDCEIIVGKPTDKNVYNITQSAVMSVGKMADIHLHVIDLIGDTRPFIRRYADLTTRDWLPHTNIHVIEQTPIYNLDELIAIEDKFIVEGYEAIMLRDPEGRYKYGRSTLNEQILMKYKRFTDVEVIVVDFIEQMDNKNEAMFDPLGYTKRGTAREGLEPAGTLGKFVVLYNELQLEIGCGSFSHVERKFIWEHPSMFKGRKLVMRFFGVGQEGYLPRHPRAVGWRTDI